ncbi:hypothetical protein BKA63DRAFT_105968 [Paraphoma chrysanthemicola]|nr:hypothetical protein BKA63DRAFT_105968 [Paraphoma chrysanthemicola]
MTLIHMPTEIRLQIYSYVVPDAPLKFPSNVYSGLLYCCKTIKDELEPELCKSIAVCAHEIAKRIREKGDEILYTPPTTLSGWLHLTFSRPKTKNMFVDGDPFLEFMHLHFITLTITFHNDAQGYEYYRGRPETYQVAARTLATHIRKSSRLDTTGACPAMRNCILDWSRSPSYASDWIMKSLGGNAMDLWEADAWLDDWGVMTGVSFSKKELEPLRTLWIDD